MTVSLSGEDIRLSPFSSSKEGGLSIVPAGVVLMAARVRRTHILVEIVHESNGKFLRQNNREARRAAAIVGFRKSDASQVMTSYQGTLSLQPENRSMPDSSITFPEELDLPMLQAGRIHSHLTLDTLCVQFEPHIMVFWETVLGLSSDPLLRAADMEWEEKENDQRSENRSYNNSDSDGLEDERVAIVIGK